MSASLFAPIASAATPGPNTPQPPSSSAQASADAKSFYAHYNQAWLQAKLAHHVRSGMTKSTKKGDKVTQSVVSSNVASYAAYPSSDILYTNYVQNVWEPSNGQYANNGWGTSSGDDYNNAWYSDLDFFDLCGPGAADIALDYWPVPPNSETYYPITDTNFSNYTMTGWTGNRMRGYITYLAWAVAVPSGFSYWNYLGTMYPNKYPTIGMNNYQMADVLNWELSGHANTTQFYIPTWWNTSSQAGLLASVEDDIVNSYVPVVAEVNAQLLPNWNNYGGDVHHFITIIGYDSSNYYYTDTCGQSTYCNYTNNNINSDGGIKKVPQWQMWNAITSVPVNPENTDALGGDGGWIW